jgi:mannitol/fructose-specific phosphotransferase system IIA component (Ntr-type)
MLNDLVGWIGFAVVLALLPADLVGGATSGHGVTLTIGLTLAFLAVMLTLGRWFFHRTMPWVQAHWSWPGGMLALVFVAAMLCAAFTEWLGIHSIFGAFVAGVAIGDSYHLTERTRDTIHQFVTNIFAPIFFASIGLRIDFIDAFDPLTVFVVLGVAITGKSLGCFFGARLGKTSPRESAAVAAGMTCQGAVGIILGQLAYDAGLITERLLVAIVIMALLTSLISGPAIQKILKTRSKLRLIDMLTDRHVVMQPKATSVEGIIAELSRRAAQLADLDGDKVTERVTQRERLMHTGLPGGLAVPHARLPDLSKPIMVLGRPTPGIDFDAVDGVPARLVCLILTPEDQPEAQIELLATVAETFADPAIKGRALSSHTATEFRAALNLAANKPSDELTPHDDQTL